MGLPPSPRFLPPSRRGPALLTVAPPRPPELAGGITDLADRVLYGGKKSTQDFGTALYELREEKRTCCTYKNEIATFYEDYIVIRNSTQFMCFPLRYEEFIMPKYKMVGVTVFRGTSWTSIIWGAILTFLGFLFFLLGTSAEPQAGELVGTGLLLLLLGIILLVLPMCLSRYVTELQMMADPEDPAAPLCGYTSYWLRTFIKPDDDFIMQYVYGALNSNIEGYHALAHLIDDNLVQKVKPRMMTAIQIEEGAVPPPPQPAAGYSATVGAAKGYGRELYKLEQTTGIFGEEVGPCSKVGTSCLRNTTKAIFCENLVVVQIEQKILCYPVTYRREVIPKYKIASCAFRKGGATSSVFWLALSHVVGIALLITAGQQPQEGELGYNPDVTALLLGIGLTKLFVGLIGILVTLFFSTYNVDLTFAKPKASKSESNVAFLKRALLANLVGARVFTLVLREDPDRQFIMSYVYGSLGKNMGGYHALTHLIKDNLVEPPEPRTIMGAIASTGMSSYIPIATMVDVDHGEVHLNTSAGASGLPMAQATALPMGAPVKP